MTSHQDADLRVAASGQDVGRALNIAGAGASSTWEDVWPGIADDFGLYDGGHLPNGQLAGEAWVRGKTAEWDQWTRDWHLKGKTLHSICAGFITTLAWVCLPRSDSTIAHT